MVKGEYILGFGILIDMISTIYGVSLGFTEINFLGINGVLILNILLLYVCLFTIKLDRPKLLNIFLYIVGILRFSVGIHNIILII